MSQTSLFYTIKKGDTLGNIARQNGTTVEELSKINGIKNPDRIEAGQQIALKAEAVCGVASCLTVIGTPYPVRACFSNTVARR